MAEKNYKITKNKDKSFIIILSLDKSSIKSKYDQVVKQAAKTIDIKGFRPGKAPRDMVEKEISKPKVFEEIIYQLLSPKYWEIIKLEDLKPIIEPKIKLSNPPLDLNKDWTFEVESCELPEVSLKPYEPAIKKLTKEKLEEKEKTNKIIETISKLSIISLPQVLVDSEINSHLSKLIDQTSQAGLSLEQYFSSKKTTLEDFKKQAVKDINENWKIDLCLKKIADDVKITLSDEELNKEIPEKANDQQKSIYSYFLLRQKTIKYLLDLK